MVVVPEGCFLSPADFAYIWLKYGSGARCTLVRDVPGPTYSPQWLHQNRTYDTALCVHEPGTVKADI